MTTQEDKIQIDLVSEIFKIVNDENFKKFYKNNLVHYQNTDITEKQKIEELIFLYKEINQNRLDTPYTDIVNFDDDNNLILTQDKQVFTVHTNRLRTLKNRKNINYCIACTDYTLRLNFTKFRDDNFITEPSKKGIKTLSFNLIHKNDIEIKNDDIDILITACKLGLENNNIIAGKYLIYPTLLAKTMYANNKTSQRKITNEHSYTQYIIDRLKALKNKIVDFECEDFLKSSRVLKGRNISITKYINAPLFNLTECELYDNNTKKRTHAFYFTEIPFLYEIIVDFFKYVIQIEQQYIPTGLQINETNISILKYIFKKLKTKQSNDIILEKMLFDLDLKHTKDTLKARKDRVEQIVHHLQKFDELRIKSYQWTKTNKRENKLIITRSKPIKKE